MVKNRKGSDQALGTGATGGWTEEELERAPSPAATPEGAARQDDDPELQREGKALANQREAVGEKGKGTAEPYPGGPVTRESSNRRGMHPGSED